MKSNRKIIYWVDYYNKNFCKTYDKFLCKFVCMKSNLSDISAEEKFDFCKQYYSFLRLIVRLYCYFCCYNGILAENKDSSIQVFIKSGMLNKNFYQLYKSFQKDKVNNYVNLNISSILKKKYLNIFSEINNYFECRIKIEEEYGQFNT